MDRRENDELIIYKLDNLAEKLDNHIKSTNHAIHGNGNIGIKTQVEVLKTRVALVSIILLGAWSAIVGAFVRMKS